MPAPVRNVSGALLELTIMPAGRAGIAERPDDARA